MLFAQILLQLGSKVNFGKKHLSENCQKIHHYMINQIKKKTICLISLKCFAL